MTGLGFRGSPALCCMLETTACRWADLRITRLCKNYGAVISEANPDALFRLVGVAEEMHRERLARS